MTETDGERGRGVERANEREDILRERAEKEMGTPQ